MKKIAWLLLMIMLLSGCTSKDESDNEVMRLTDGVGRTVKVQVDASNIAALDSFTSEAMVMIGAGEKLCGSPSGTISDEILCEIYPDLPSVPVPLSGGTVNIETLAASDPDVVFIKSSLYYTEGETEKLDKMNIPYLVVMYSTMEEQIKSLMMIGKVCGKSEKMDELCDYYSQTIETVTECASRIPEDDIVSVYHAINEMVRTDGATSLGTDWITCVGARNVSADENVEYGKTDYAASLEQIYLWDPDIVICNSAGTVDYLMSDSKWQGLRAVKNGAVEAMPVGASRWGQRGSVETFFAMLWLGKTIYPDQYAKIDLKEEVMKFYSDFLDVELTDEEYGAILSGNGIRAGSGK